MCSSDLAALMLASAAMFAAPLSQAQDFKPSADEYRASCQVCHGPGGQGDGPMARLLIVRPADLTTLSKRNDGKFPLLRVFQMIDGRAVVGAHGERTMPVWGQRYSTELGDRYGPYGAEAAVRARILELVYYVQSLQKE